MNSGLPFNVIVLPVMVILAILHIYSDYKEHVVETYVNHILDSMSRGEPHVTIYLKGWKTRLKDAIWNRVSAKNGHFGLQLKRESRGFVITAWKAEPEMIG